MKFEVLKEKDVSLMDRKRVTLQVDFEGKPTPSGKELRESVADYLKTKPKLIAIRHIYQHFGKPVAKVIVHVYKDEAKLKLFEGEKALYKEEKSEQPSEEPSNEGSQESEQKEEEPSNEGS